MTRHLEIDPRNDICGFTEPRNPNDLETRCGMTAFFIPHFISSQNEVR